MDKKASDYLIEHEDYLNWDMNTGDKTIHARQMPGRFRNIKWIIMSVLLIPFFLTPYLTWDLRQAVFFDIPARKFYLFNVVVWPQDLIILALLMLFAFILLFSLTAIAGRVFCGSICPQTLWTDLMTLTERWAEGKASHRIKLDAMPWNFEKIRKKAFKHAMWITICLVTAVTFLGYFSGIYDAWSGLFSFSYNIFEWVSVGLVFALFYVNTGFVREQVCQWMCPYSRIQAVMTDKDTITTTYDYHRGEERARLKRGQPQEDKGDCIDCNLCVTVCPTGVDIRKGNQIGCINCGICIDACDDIMEKIERPKGLIRFMSHHELEKNTEVKHHFLRLRPIIYMLATTITFAAIMYSLLFKDDIDMSINHERSPTYTIMSDRTVQNMYHIIVMNKTEHSADFSLSTSGIEGAKSNYDDKIIHLKTGEAKKIDLRIKVPQKHANKANQKINIHLQSTSEKEVHVTNRDAFFGPGN
ncbi:MAG: cytochrome c oxidase accessory protein CcoG [Ghiorsea sp.]